MLKLEQLSDRLVKIIDQLLMNQNLCKLVKYDNDTPLDQPDIFMPADSLMMDKIYPIPLKKKVSNEARVELRVYFPKVGLEKKAIQNVKLQFDIILPSTNEAHIIFIDGKMKVRYFEIMKEVIQTLYNRDFGIGATIDNFTDGYLKPYNEDYDAWTFFAEITQFATGMK